MTPAAYRTRHLLSQAGGNEAETAREHLKQAL